jgi:hypothetical protein
MYYVKTWNFLNFFPNLVGLSCDIQSQNNHFTEEVMVFNATFYNISVISWQSDLLVEETRVPGENHRSAASH